MCQSHISVVLCPFSLKSHYTHQPGSFLIIANPVSQDWICQSRQPLSIQAWQLRKLSNLPPARIPHFPWKLWKPFFRQKLWNRRNSCGCWMEGVKIGSDLLSDGSYLSHLHSVSELLFPGKESVVQLSVFISDGWCCNNWFPIAQHYSALETNAWVAALLTC